MSELYIGVMSGTSLDGIDITLCEIDENHCKEIHSKEYSLPLDTKEKILHIIANETTLEKIGQLHTQLGLLFAESINDFLQTYNLSKEDIKAIGLHGQTLWHDPNSPYPFSMQLGSPSVVYAKTSIAVVNDFRNIDIANGGQGAPFAPVFHKFLFSHFKQKIAVVNIGGMANITFLNENLRGWDTGPGNVLLDYWTHKIQNQPYDRNGDFAKSGAVNQALLNHLMSDPYFKKLPPKSTGREYFNSSWLEQHLKDFQTIKEEDIQRTLLEVTALSITNEIEKTDIELLVVCGGGAKNKFLIERLNQLSDKQVTISDTFNISSDFMEAMAFAWLAYKRVHKSYVELCSVTGATKNSILGGLYG